LYFEEIEVGYRLITAGRTVTEADVVAFAGLSGDFTQIHTDAEFTRDSPFGQRVAHGMLIMSIASGLVAQTGLLEGTVMAFREIESWKFVKPVFFGDTVHVEVEIVETKALRRLGGGLVGINLYVKNQAQDTLMKGTWTVLFANKPEGETR
jgi:acyl dehydratase